MRPDEDAALDQWSALCRDAADDAGVDIHDENLRRFFDAFTRQLLPLSTMSRGEHLDALTGLVGGWIRLVRDGLK